MKVFLLLVVELLLLFVDGFLQWHHARPWHGQSKSFVAKTANVGDRAVEGNSSAFFSPRDQLEPTYTSTSKSYFDRPSNGLSKFHNAILGRVVSRQTFVTGRFPLTVTVTENPTRRWLAAAETEILVNGTNPSRSFASLDRFNWLDKEERSILRETFSMVSMELLAEIHTDRPGYLQVLDRAGAGSLAKAMRQEDNSDNDHTSSISFNQFQPTSASSRPFSSFLSERPSQWHQNKWKLAMAMMMSDKDPHSPHFKGEKGDRLWITGFSLVGSQGIVRSVDCDDGMMSAIEKKTSNNILWPNEVQGIPHDLVKSQKSASSTDSGTVTDSQRLMDALLVCDGFLVPGKDRGGLYAVRHPGCPELERIVRLTTSDDELHARSSEGAKADDRWFYHRAVWIDLTGDGRQSILAARCKVTTSLRRNEDIRISSGIAKTGELVWIECPQPPLVDVDTGTPLNYDGTAFDPLSGRHTPWKTHVLASGPDVMFCVADLDPKDGTIEVIASEFFRKRVSLHSIERGPCPRVVFSRSIDDNCGAAFGSILADLTKNHDLTSRSRVIDSGSTVPTLRAGDSFSHLLVTSHECSYSDTEKTEQTGRSTATDGGSLFAYKVPTGRNGWKTEPWVRTTVATGFKVKSKLGNMINPGAPGFVYTFYPKRKDKRSPKRPFIAVAGDCAESAYIFRPATNKNVNKENDPSTHYDLMVEVECGATVGSIAVGYDDFSSSEQEEGYAKLYIPCYEKDKILVFGLGSGEDDIEDGW